MGIDYLMVDEHASVEQALAAVRASEIPPEALQVVFLRDAAAC